MANPSKPVPPDVRHRYLVEIGARLVAIVVHHEAVRVTAAQAFVREPRPLR